MFESIAKDLLRKSTDSDKSNNSPSNSNSKLERASALMELAAAGFSRSEIFYEIRSLYDECEDHAVKRQLLDMVLKVQGLYKDEEKREAPTFILNVIGDKDRIESMLCPPHAQSI